MSFTLNRPHFLSGSERLRRDALDAGPVASYARASWLRFVEFLRSELGWGRGRAQEPRKFPSFSATHPRVQGTSPQKEGFLQSFQFPSQKLHLMQSFDIGRWGAQRFVFSVFPPVIVMPRRSCSVHQDVGCEGSPAPVGLRVTARGWGEGATGWQALFIPWFTPASVGTIRGPSPSVLQGQPCICSSSLFPTSALASDRG